MNRGVATPEPPLPALPSVHTALLRAEARARAAGRKEIRLEDLLGGIYEGLGQGPVPPALVAAAREEDRVLASILRSFGAEIDW